jgi:F-type H+-transporting ATPase subunit delta
MSIRASAARYAKALLDVAIAEADPEQAERDLSWFASLVQAHAELQRVLVNPVVPAARKRAVVEDLVARANVSAPVAKLILLLAARDRLVLVPDLLEVYRERLREHRQVVNAEVTTAAPLGPEHAEALRQRLAATTGRSVTMTTTVDPSLIGGIVTRIGSTVYDGSVARQLETIRQSLNSR